MAFPELCLASVIGEHLYAIHPKTCQLGQREPTQPLVHVVAKGNVVAILAAAPRHVKDEVTIPVVPVVRTVPLKLQPRAKASVHCWLVSDSNQ